MKIWTDKNYPIIISCAKGLSCWTEIEVRDMGYKPIEVTENWIRTVYNGIGNDSFATKPTR